MDDVGCIQACNLKPAQTKGKFVYVNALSTTYEWAVPSPSSGVTPGTPGIDSWSLAHDEEESLKGLYFKVKKFVEINDDPDGEACIIIDNLSVLLDTCTRPELVLDFVRYLELLIRRMEVRGRQPTLA